MAADSSELSSLLAAMLAGGTASGSSSGGRRSSGTSGGALRAILSGLGEIVSTRGDAVNPPEPAVTFTEMVHEFNVLKGLIDEVDTLDLGREPAAGVDLIGRLITHMLMRVAAGLLDEPDDSEFEDDGADEGADAAAREAQNTS